MRAGPNATMQRFLALLASGEVARARDGAASLKEWAARLGMTDDQFCSVRRRAEQLGHAVPRWGDAADTQSGARGTHDRDDFADEERTRPDIQVLDKQIDADHAHPVQTGGHRFTPVTRHLNRADVPDGSIIAVLSDIHIPHHDADAVRLAIECCEAAGATHVILNGDIADCGPSSRHEEKRRREMLENGDIERATQAGRWIYDWARTKRCILLRGNHEAWVETEIRGSVTFHRATPEYAMGLPENGDGWEVLPSLSRIRLGSRVWEHGEGFFKSGSPGANPGARLKAKAPDQTTSIGHCHIKHASFWTTEDEYGVTRTRAAFFNGHMSRPEAHGEYAGTYLNWQQSFELTRVYWIDDRPRFTTDQPEIHRDRYGRPIFEYQGKIYR